MTIQKNTTTSLPLHPYHQTQKKLDQYTIKPVHSTESRLVHHYQDTFTPKASPLLQKDKGLLHQLLDERERARKLFQEKNQVLYQTIISLIKHYNYLVEILVKLEAKEGCQIDQLIQHFLVSHKSTFLSYGISVRQYLYLEYDPIVLKHQIEKNGSKTTQVLLLGKKGLLYELLYLFDRLVSQLGALSESNESRSQIDLKA